MNVAVGPYYESLKAKVFGPQDWKLAAEQTMGKSRAKFLLNQDFNDTSLFVAYDFFVELYQRFGRPVIPVGVENGCLALTAHFPETVDRQNVEFRYLMLKDPRYHELFREFGVSMIYLHGFPAQTNTDFGWNRFKLTPTGVPVPH